MSATLPLNPLELDALTELVNIGVSGSAASLREMVGKEIILSVPKVELLARDEAVIVLRQSEAAKLVAVHQVFEGDITGRAMLIFPEANSLEIVRAVAGGSLSLEDIMDLEHEALAETGRHLVVGLASGAADRIVAGIGLAESDREEGHGQRDEQQEAADDVALRVSGDVAGPA